LRLFDEHSGFARILFEVMPTDPEGMKRGLKLHDEHIEKVTAVFRKGMELGQFDQVDPLYLALSLDGIIHSFVSYWLRHGPRETLEDRTARLKEAFLSRICTSCRESSHLGEGKD